MKPANKMSSASTSGINLQDILYALFKHKWKIIILTLLGIGAAGALYNHYKQSPTYQTRAKLMVRYVVERTVTDPDAPANYGTGAGGMDAEMQIVTSADLSMATAAALGPDNVLEGSPTLREAAAHIMAGLTANASPGSVIELVYRDKDPDTALKVLRQYIQSYFARHLEIHRSTEAFDQVRVQADQARSALRVTEDQINTLKSKSGVLSIDATLTEFETRRQLSRSSLMEAQAALAHQRAKVAALTNRPPGGDEAGLANADEEDSATGISDLPLDGTDEKSRRETAEALFEFQGLASRLALLRQERDKMLLQRPATHPMIQSLDRQIAQVQRQSLDLTGRYPEFAAQAAEVPGQQMGPVTTIAEERALESALEARVKSIADEVEMIEGQVENLSKLGFQLGDLERRREMEEERYRYFQSSLEKAEVDERLDPSKIPNISIVENPAIPVKTVGEDTMKIVMGVAASGLAFGLGLAFLIEFVVRRRVTRPGDIRNRLQLPLLMSIPYIRSRDGLGKLMDSGANAGHIGSDNAPSSVSERRAGSNDKATSTKRNEKEHFITPFARAIHDRIIFNFEINNIDHKPKLVAFAGLTTGAGTSTVAAGVAKAFSEEGNRKVLLVDLNTSAEGRQQSHPADSLRRAIEHSQSSDFLGNQKNLHFASAPTRRNGNGNAALAPIALQEIMPHLQASDFDYIIFDMPPVDPMSPTLAMAGFMDKVLLVVDGESTTPENLRWAYTELERGRADVSCIFNKARNHAPRWVLGEA